MSASTIPTTALEPDRGQLLAAIDAGQAMILEFVDEVGEEPLMRHTDARGWNGRDHLAHIVAWQGALISWLTGGTRAEGLGVDEATWETRDYDLINEHVRQNTTRDSVADVLDRLARNGEHLRRLVATLPDATLMAPYSHYPPVDPRVSPPAATARVLRVVGSHASDHLGYIRETLAGATGDLPSGDEA